MGIAQLLTCAALFCVFLLIPWLEKLAVIIAIVPLVCAKKFKLLPRFMLRGMYDFMDWAVERKYIDITTYRKYIQSLRIANIVIQNERIVFNNKTYVVTN